MEGAGGMAIVGGTDPAGAGGPAAPRPGRRLQWTRIAALVFVVGLTAAIYLIQDRVSPASLRRFGYPGIFLLAVMAYATIILPAPGLAIVFAAGGVEGFSPLGVALAAGLGAAVGELSGYLAGFSGQAIIENRVLYERFVGWMQRYGPWAVTVLAAIPSPFFDLAGLAAGALKMPLGRFLVFCALGQTIKMLVVAYAGSLSIEWITRLFG